MLVATEKFDALARLSAQQSGLRDPRIIAVPHPLGGVSQGVLLARADAAVDAVVAQLMGD